MVKVKCPYFSGKTNGSKLYINCSGEKFINDESLRKEFVTTEARKVCYELNCCNEFVLCQNYVTLNKLQVLADNEKLLRSDFMKKVENLIYNWDLCLTDELTVLETHYLEMWKLAQVALKDITGTEWHFARTERYYGICNKDKKFLLVKWKL